MQTLMYQGYSHHECESKDTPFSFWKALGARNSEIPNHFNELCPPPDSARLLNAVEPTPEKNEYDMGL